LEKHLTFKVKRLGLKWHDPADTLLCRLLAVVRSKTAAIRRQWRAAMRCEVVPLTRSSMPLSLLGIEGGLDPAAPDEDGQNIQ
jgi:hypothetical protein